MMTSRKLSRAIGILSLCCASSAFPVGLGEIQLDSALNEPLNAEIQILGVGDLEEAEIRVKLATAEEFDRAGVSRDFVLTHLDFDVDLSNVRSPVVRVSTKEPILEPYLDFLVSLQWPAGKVMREYTLLLDLPIYTGEKKAAKQVSRAGSGDRVSMPKEPSTRPVQSAPGQTLSGEDYRVVSGDTLWSIAERARPQNATVQQTMDALYQNNQNAFIRGDANLLKAGSVLRLPSGAQVREQDGSMVTSQIGLEADKPAGAPQLNDAARSSNSRTKAPPTSGRLELASASAAEQADSELISAQGSSDASAVVGGSGVNAQLSNELAIAQDEVNKSQRENAELRERIALLEEQVSTMSSMVDVRDEQLAAVEQRAQQGAEERPAAEAAVKPSTTADDPQSTPWYLILIGAIIALLAALFGFIKLRGRAAKTDVELAPANRGGYQDYQPVRSARMTAMKAEAALDDLDDVELSPDDDLFSKREDEDDFFAEESAPAVSEPEEESLVGALAEADIYLSLGNVGEAINVLEESRAKDPDNTEVRLKLMEILFTQNRRGELKPLFEEIRDSGDTEATTMAAAIMGPADERVTSINEAALDEFSQDDDLLADTSATLEVDSDTTDVEQDSTVEVALDGLDKSGGAQELSEFADEFDLDAMDDTTDSDVDVDELFKDLEQGAESIKREKSSAQSFDEFVDFDEIDELEDFDSDAEVDTKIDLAKAYVELGDKDGAREILNEVIAEADETGQAKARELLETL